MFDRAVGEAADVDLPVEWTLLASVDVEDRD
jgi:hypothetical protein